MKSICLINAYFGKFPNYFSLWLESVKENPTIDFLIVTDVEEDYEYPENVIIKKMKFNELQEKIKDLYDFKVAIDTPYKLCDYKVAYGEIFRDEIKEYDFWGYCDIDLIFGDIRKYITEDILNTYDKIGMHGHFTIYRNCDEMIYLYKRQCPNVINYKMAYKTNWVWHFDEYPGMSYICEEQNINYYDMEEYADLDWCRHKFVKVYDHSDKKSDEENIKQIFYWKDGKLYNLVKDDESISSNELMYVHLQKRKMENQLEDIKDGFYIVPNRFLKIEKQAILEALDIYSQDGFCQAYENFKKECFKNRFKLDYWKYKVAMIKRRK